MRVLLISTYELGHQPLHLAVPAGLLRAGGHEVRAVDLAVDDLDPGSVEWAEAVAFSVPMHTATRLAATSASAIKVARPELPVCAYGLYAGAAAATGPFDQSIAGEYHAALAEWVDAVANGKATTDTPGATRVELGRPRSGESGPAPDREGLAPLERYAHLIDGADRKVVAGYVEASRGCSHRCRHCPVPVVYDGRVRTVPVEAVVTDVSAQVDKGAGHITFGDPDFLNAPAHARRVVDAVHRRHPGLTFDLTVKVEHILRHPDIWAEWAGAGLLFVVSAFESTDDRVLARLDKGHTAADASAATALLRRAGVAVRPSFLPFTPWTTIGQVVDLVDFVADNRLSGNVDAVQYSIRLLLPPGSLLLADPEVAALAGPYDPAVLAHPWRSAHPGMDDLQAELAEVAEAHAGSPAAKAFAVVHGAVGAWARRLGSHLPAPLTPGADAGPSVPRLSEPWFCCAEPTSDQRRAVSV
jgi:radical SAM superfamily enzyme YgiQ (UPF0313 family)